MRDGSLPFIPMGKFRLVTAPGDLLANQYNTKDLALDDARRLKQGSAVAVVAVAQETDTFGDTVEVVLKGDALQRALRKPRSAFENFPR